MQTSEDVIHHRDLHNSSRPTQSHSIIAKNELFSFVARSISLLFLLTSRSKKRRTCSKFFVVLLCSFLSVALMCAL